MQLKRELVDRLVLALVVAVAACGDSEAMTDGAVADSRGVDAVVVDGSGSDSGAADARLADASIGCPDTPSCFGVVPTPADAILQMVSGAPPVLAGGTAPRGRYDLVDVFMYWDAAFSSLVTNATVVATPGGTNRGVADVREENWLLSATLDLDVSFDLSGQSHSEQLSIVVDGGGCYTVSGTQLHVQFLQCNGSWPQGAPPDAFNYETSKPSLQLELVVSKAILVSLVPPQEQATMDLALDGPATFVLQLNQP